MKNAGLNEAFKRFVEGKHAKYIPRTELRSNEEYELNLLLNRASRIRETIKKVRKYVANVDKDNCYIDDILSLKVDLLKVESEILKFFEGKTRSNASSVIENIYKTKIELPVSNIDPFDTLSSYSIAHMFDADAPTPITYDFE